MRSTVDRRWRACLGLVVAAVVLMAASWPGSADASMPTGIYVSGPLTEVSFDTSYSYTVTVVTNKTYDKATVEFFVPASGCYPTFHHTKLIAHHPWTGHFTTEFRSDKELSNGLMLAVVVVPPHRGYSILLRKHFPVTAASGQTPDPSQEGAIHCLGGGSQV